MGTNAIAPPSSGFLLVLHILMWTTLSLGLIALLVVFMMT